MISHGQPDHDQNEEDQTPQNEDAKDLELMEEEIEEILGEYIIATSQNSLETVNNATVDPSVKNPTANQKPTEVQNFTPLSDSTEGKLLYFHTNLTVLCPKCNCVL